MSNEALNWAWSLKGMQPVDRLLMLALGDYADESWSCYPGQQLLAERACCSERTVRDRLKALEERGLFRRERRYSDGLRTSDRFVLNRAYRQDLPVGAYRQNEATLPADSGDLTGRPLPGNPQNPYIPQIPPVVPRALSKADQISAGFEAFWKVYPRRAGKQGAQRAFSRAVSRASMEEVLEGARRFAADPNLPEKQFIPHPATWLNQGRWEDDPLPPRMGSAGVVETGRRTDEILRARAAEQQAIEGAA